MAAVAAAVCHPNLSPATFTRGATCGWKRTTYLNGKPQAVVRPRDLLVEPCEMRAQLGSRERSVGVLFRCAHLKINELQDGGHGEAVAEWPKA